VRTAGGTGIGELAPDRGAGAHGAIPMSEVKQEKCPVCGWDNGESARDVQVGEQTVRVCCEECARALASEAAPAQPA
jgi:hypothetical protein